MTEERSIEVYEVPEIGRVELRKAPELRKYNFWIEGCGFTEGTEDINQTREIMGGFVLKMLRDREMLLRLSLEEAERRYKGKKDKGEWLKDYQK
jgi:hypothetical protein